MHPLTTAGAVTLLAAVTAAGCGRPAAPVRGPVADPVKVKVGKGVPEGEGLVAIDKAPFTLFDQQGREFDSARLAGRVWVGSIFFANCPGPCFRENQAVAEILAEIKDPDFMAVSLTCDPDNDTPPVLLRYAERFQADPDRWKFLSGDIDVLRRVGQKTFGLTVEVGVHSERGVVFDRQGRLRGAHHLLDPMELAKLKKLIRAVLAEAATAPAVSATDGGPSPAEPASKQATP
jgi:cytochrome oxidase Cu insertion factor (SCO1/SenC/PrrC family)